MDESLNGEKLKRELAFDQYGRFAIIKEIIDFNRKGGKRFKILDVGGRGNMMRRFLSEDEVYYLDPYVDTKDDNYIKGDGCEMPIEDNKFDWVVSTDVFEHIPKEKRVNFIQENIRVAKLGVVLVAPFYSEEARRSEININENHKILTGGSEHVWLKEHIEHGLPKESEIENFLNKNNYLFQKLSNNELPLWELLLGIEMIAEYNCGYPSNGEEKELRKRLEEFNYFYNTEIFPHDFSEPSYRKVYFIKKEKELKNLEKKVGLIDSKLRQKIIKNSLNLMCEIDRTNKKILVNQSSRTVEMDKKTELDKLKEKLKKRDKEILSNKAEIEEYAKIVHDREARLEAMVDSMRWKVPNYFYKLYKNRIKQFRPKHALKITKLGISNLRKEGITAFSKNTINYLLYGKEYFIRKPIDPNSRISNEEYEGWINKNEIFNKERALEDISDFKIQPRISIILPVYNAYQIFLRRAIFSIVYQYYPNWELIIVDNCSSERIIRKILADFLKEDKRIKIIYQERKTTTAKAINEASKKATGNFIGFIGQEDELSLNALYENVKFLNLNPNPDLIYSDEDEIDENGLRFNPNFKPDWSPELLISSPYAGNFKIIRSSLFQQLGGYRQKFEKAYDYDLFLRLAEKTERVAHITKILYHNRNHTGLATTTAFNNRSVLENMEKSLQEAIDRRKIKGKALIPACAKKLNINVCHIKFGTNSFPDEVTIIIPTKDKIEILKKCIDSIKKKTLYKNYKILVINNNSKEKRTFNYFRSNKINYLDIPTDSFNFSKINNIAVKKSKSELILLLNNDTEVISPDWLSEMVGTISLDKKIGAVGAKLLYGDKKVQHAGVIVGLSQHTASHANKMIHCDDRGYQNYNLVIRNYSAVTAACMLTRKNLYEKVGGLDEDNLAVAFNDVDYCLKLTVAGYRIVYNPDVLLYHHEYLSRKVLGDNMAEVDYFRKKWKHLIEKDPFYNINLSLENEQFEIKKD